MAHWQISSMVTVIMDVHTPRIGSQGMRAEISRWLPDRSVLSHKRYRCPGTVTLGQPSLYRSHTTTINHSQTSTLMRRLPPPRRSPFEPRHQYPYDWPPPSFDGPVGKAAVIVSGLILLGLVVAMLSTAPGLAALIAAFAGIATAPVVVPYLVIRVVTATLERQRSSHQPIRDDTEPDIGTDPAADD